MMNRKKKYSILLKIFFLVFTFFILNYNMSFATDVTVDGLMEAGKGGKVVTATYNVMSIATRVIRTVGIGISIIMLTYVAIRYMTAAPQEKAEFKKSATAMIVGAIVLFGATNILYLINDFANQNI